MLGAGFCRILTVSREDVGVCVLWPLSLALLLLAAVMLVPSTLLPACRRRMQALAEQPS